MSPGAAFTPKFQNSVPSNPTESRSAFFLNPKLPVDCELVSRTLRRKCIFKNVASLTRSIVDSNLSKVTKVFDLPSRKRTLAISLILISGAPNHSKRSFEPSVREHVAHGRLRALRKRQVQRQDDGTLLQEGWKFQRSASATSTNSADGTKVGWLQPSISAKTRKQVWYQLPGQHQ